MSDVFEKLKLVYSRLQDEESRNLFNIRLKYAIDRKTEDFFDSVGKLYQDWHSRELTEKLIEYPASEIVVFGSGYVGRITKRLLNHWGYDRVAFCDIQHIGEIIDGAEVLSVEDAVREHSKALFIIGSTRFKKEMRENLLAHGFPPIQILIPEHKYLMGARGKQYFDLFEPVPDEVYVDAGVFDGQSVLSFYSWAQGQYKKIYGFEPLPEMCTAAEKILTDNDVKNVELVNCATWDKKEKLHFSIDDNNMAGSGVVDSAGCTIEVQGADIDSVVAGDKVTFIKMDIEGSELRALQGAKHTIQDHHPRLAICIYHKPEDIAEIGSYILSLFPDYKLYIRHYASNCWETVLYAIP